MQKVALITGGTKGIGRAIAEYFLADGMRVAITGTQPGSVDPAQSELAQRHPGSVLAYVADVRDESRQHAIVQDILTHWGRLDVLVANAGLGHFAPIDEMTTAMWSDTIDVNLTGVFHSVRACIEALKQTRGYIITIASLAGTNFFARGAAYNASKFGLVGMSQAMMLDLRPYDIKVTTIMPGSVTTHFNGNEPSAADAWKIHPDDIAQICIDLLKMPARTLPSKVEVRPSRPDLK